MTDIATRLYLAALENRYDTTTEGWLQIVDRAGLKLVDKSEGTDSIDDILAQGWAIAAHNVDKWTHSWVFHNKEWKRTVKGVGATNAQALDEVRRQIRGES